MLEKEGCDIRSRFSVALHHFDRFKFHGAIIANRKTILFLFLRSEKKAWVLRHSCEVNHFWLAFKALYQEFRYWCYIRRYNRTYQTLDNWKLFGNTTYLISKDIVGFKAIPLNFVYITMTFLICLLNEYSIHKLTLLKIQFKV